MDINSIKDTFTSKSRDHKMLYAAYMIQEISYYSDLVKRSRVPESNLVSEIQFPRISFPFIVVVGIVEHAE